VYVVYLPTAGSLAAIGVPPNLTLDLSFAIIGSRSFSRCSGSWPNAKRGNPVFLRPLVFENACEVGKPRARAGVSRMRHADFHPLGSDDEPISGSPKNKRSSLVCHCADERWASGPCSLGTVWGASDSRWNRPPLRRGAVLEGVLATSPRFPGTVGSDDSRIVVRDGTCLRSVERFHLGCHGDSSLLRRMVFQECAFVNHCSLCCEHHRVDSVDTWMT
jgi:hypothetical protein